MLIDIYRTTDTRVVAVPAGIPPPEVKSRFKRVVLVRGQPRIALNPDAVLPLIEEVGWAAL